jgi:hypothetical protein
MDIIKKTYRLVLISAVLLGFNSVSHAIPTLTFGGSLDYNSGAGVLSLNGILLGSQSILATPDLPSSSISLNTTLITSDSAFGVTVGTFGNGSIQIDDNTTAADYLLTGVFTAAQMGGADGNDNGVLSLEFSPTGGTLLNYFSDPSGMLALVFNLGSYAFGEGMFDSSFTGSVNGNIVSGNEVYEPGVLSLLLAGVGLITVSGLYRRWTRSCEQGK